MVTGGGDLAGVTFDSAAYPRHARIVGGHLEEVRCDDERLRRMGHGRAWLMMSVITLVVLAVIVVGVVALSRRSHPAAPPPAAAPAAGGSAAALRALDERFARGEIDEAEYTTRRDLLTQR